MLPRLIDQVGFRDFASRRVCFAQVRARFCSRKILISITRDAYVPTVCLSYRSSSKLKMCGVYAKGSHLGSFRCIYFPILEREDAGLRNFCRN